MAACEWLVSGAEGAGSDGRAHCEYFSWDSGASIYNVDLACFLRFGVRGGRSIGQL